MFPKIGQRKTSGCSVASKSSSHRAFSGSLQVDLASSLLALARLSFAQLVDAGKLFSRSAMVRSPECAAALLEAFLWGLDESFRGNLVECDIWRFEEVIISRLCLC